ncbi:hypothetical protein AEAC466_15205 [Asticcacaulis sp. AC466]|uniref:2-amino-4-hydroxy-6- hydroxymethyldihydropteridine diphosphokinase n=1 Tax=Asticcacaulis sp. AC466 TaxID=1282362 RepID=UPI0003C3B29C|nr:2-amino-4-hydroxy-6-hydroxymethyldihydropteridine diphosphokinase [Asticcacaulis sp. AC466]ESQ82856.1 hypothetical protein AEAC466_15205 [Asticcacaulis sp. AC466]
MAEIDDPDAIFIAYGSNLLSGPETASQAFERVVKDLRDSGLQVTKISRLWSSIAWPNNQDPAYVNAVLQIRTDLQPDELLQLLHKLEYARGRVRDEKRNAPRVLDLDIVAYGRHVLASENGLNLPHPRAADRAFVMGPLAEISPGWVHPVLGRTAQDLLTTATVGRDAYPLD